jgi:hypothetical protein
MTDQFPAQRLLDLKQAARHLGRSPYSLRTLLWRRELPVVLNKIDGGRAKIWIDKKDLDGWIEQRKTTL